MSAVATLYPTSSATASAGGRSPPARRPTAPRLTFAYDAASNLTLSQNGAGAYTYGYDASGRLTTQQGLWGLSLTFSYDAAGNRTGVIDSLGGRATYTFDAADRLTSQQQGGAGQTPLRIDTDWTDRNQPSAVRRYSDLAGTTKVGETAYSYDDAGRQRNAHHKDGSAATLININTT